MTKIILALCLLISLHCSAAGLTAAIDKRVAAKGQQLTLTLTAERLDASLDEIDLRPLQGDFEIFDRAFLSSVEQRGNVAVRTQTLELRLIALRSGRLTIPSLRIGEFGTAPLTIDISDGSAEFPAVIVKSGFLQRQLYERNEATLFIDLYDDSTLQWRAPIVHAPSMQLRPLQATSRYERVGAQRYRVTRYQWGAMPLRGGNTVANFALIEATHFGERVAFRAPAAVADVTAVPTYLPPALHVGKLELVSASLPRQLRVGRPDYRVIELRGRGLSLEGLRKSIGFPVGNDQLFFYPPELTLLERDDGSQIARVAQAFKPLREAQIQLPELRIPFFDPIRREVQAVVIPAGTLQARDPLYEKLRLGGLLAAVAFSLLALLWLRRERLRERFHCFRAMRRLSRAATAAEMVRELYAQKSLREAALPSQALVQIEALIYGRASGDFRPTRDQLLREMKCRQRRRRSAKSESASKRVFAVEERVF